MSDSDHGTNSAKSIATVHIDSTLLARAHALGVDLSEVMERRLTRIVAAAEQGDILREKNRAAIDAYNQIVEEEGPFGEDERAW